MIALTTLLIVILLSLLVTRVATVVLTSTGLSREAARFQARSAFTGSGFTTSESESVVNHPVRRRVILTLMLFGSAGIVAVIAGLVISFARAGGEQWAVRSLVLAGVLFVLWLASKNSWVDRQLIRIVERGMSRYTDVPARDYARLLDLAGAYSVLELHVRDGDWVAGRTLRDLGLRAEGVAVLGVQRTKGDYIGVPNGRTTVEIGDTLILYGRRAELAELDRRPAGAEGDRAHAEGVRRQNEHGDSAPTPVEPA